jgi:hypothetical protein
MNLVDLKECMKSCVLDKLDHKNLDVDVPFFKQHPRYQVYYIHLYKTFIYSSSLGNTYLLNQQLITALTIIDEKSSLPFLVRRKTWQF